MNRVPTLVFGLALATLTAGQPGAEAQPPFQIESGRIAQEGSVANFAADGVPV